MVGLLALAAVFCAIAAAGGAMAGCLLAQRVRRSAEPKAEPPAETPPEPQTLARARLERILANIDLYDGTPAGQQRVE